jgi:hypothetical protein
MADSVRRLVAVAPLSFRRRWGLIAALGLAGALVWAVGIAARYPLAEGLLIPRGSWNTLVAPSIGALASHLAAYAALTALYAAALKLALGDDGSGRPAAAAVVVGVWLVSSGALMGAYPGGDSHDVFDYVFRGRMQTEHGASPLAVAPNQFSRSAFYLHIAWHDEVDTYGPLWEHASRAVAEAVKLALQAGGNWAPDQPSCPGAPASCRMLAAYVAGYRLFSIALTGLSGLLVYAIVRSARPGLAMAGLLAWLWNPLLLAATALGAHNDSPMLLLALAAFALCQRGRWLAGLLALVLAVHFKPIALLWLPVLLIWMLARRGWRSAAARCLAAGAISLPLSYALYAPLGGWETLPRMLHERGLYVANSGAALAFRLLREQGWTQAAAVQLTTQAASLLFAGLAAALLWRFWRQLARAPAGDRAREERIVWRAAIAVTLAYLLAGNYWVQHWYLAWLLAFAALAPDAPFTRGVLPWYGFGALAANIVLDMQAGLPGAPFNRSQAAALTLAVMWLPLALAAAWQLAAVGRRRRAQPAGAG